MAIPKEDYLACFEDWKKRWLKWHVPRIEKNVGILLFYREVISLKVMILIKKNKCFLSTVVYSIVYKRS